MPRAMQLWMIAIAAGAACGPPAPTTPPASPVAHFPPRLAPPPALDNNVRGAAYLTAVALRFQPGWSSFLGDCGTRLPIDHPLNNMALAATVDLAIGRTGAIAELVVVPSGNRDYDAAVHDVVLDATPLPAPPDDLVSDDDRVHLRWMFARDRRQAGPATATVEQVDLPLAEVTEALIRQHAWARAAQRIARADRDPARLAAAAALMRAVLDDAFASADDPTVLTALAAIARAKAVELAPLVRARAAPPAAAAVRLAALVTEAALADDHAASEALAELGPELASAATPARAVAELRLLIATGHRDDAERIVAAELARAPTPSPIAIAALAIVPDRSHARDKDFAQWLAHGDVRTRGAVCAALAGAPDPWPLLARGARDGDATVRAACATATGAQWAARRVIPAGARELAATVRSLARDRDDAVRAAAVAPTILLAAADPRAAIDRAVRDPSAGVRAALAVALALAADATPVARADAAADALRTLAQDRAPEVRAAAIAAIVARDRSLSPELAAAATDDPSAQVRLAAATGITDPALLARLAADADPRVASEARIAEVAGQGRAQALAVALARVADPQATSGDKVRAALAWLLAP